MSKDELESVRKVKITQLLNIQDTGRRICVRCPFHNEKTGSFYIYPDGSYHCFGCGKNGQNAIDFLIQAGASFGDAVEELKKYI